MAFRKPICNCPDATHRHSGDPGSSYLSYQIASDWSPGFTGVREIDGYCIHELAVIRVRKEIELAFPEGIPTDLTTPVPEKYIAPNSKPRLQKNPLFGDDFSV